MNLQLLRKKRNKSLDYIFVFILIIYAGSATVFVRSFNSWEDIVGILFICFFAVYYAINNRIQLNKTFYLLATAYIIYSLALTVKFGEVHLQFFSIYLISFYITYITIVTLRYRFFVIYEEVMYYLCIISLFFWSLHQIIPEQLTSFIDSFAFSKPGSINVKSNIIFYTINDISVVNDYVVNLGYFNLFRNSGFAWEPGAFAVFISLAIYIHFIKIKFNKLINKRFLMYLIALITTFSTTGYGIFIVLIMFYTYNQHIKYRSIYLFVSVIMGVYVLSLSFMSDKIISLSQENTTNQLVESSINNDTKYAPQRITSFIIDYQDFLNNPILGYGGHNKEMWTAKLGAEIATISGIGKLFARFGLVGVIFFFVMLLRSSKLQSQILGFKGWGFPFLIIVMISISYSLIENPLLMCFWMAALFYPYPKMNPEGTQTYKIKRFKQKLELNKLQY
ncbi:hypothetical protein [Flavobacterium sp.]|uniref:hypothetical protein n=1 Tax=Flavobacterium sp. TaxID=239 RepID=UPI003752FE3C